MLKKTIVILLSFLLILPLAACQKSNNDRNSNVIVNVKMEVLDLDANGEVKAGDGTTFKLVSYIPSEEVTTRSSESFVVPLNYPLFDLESARNKTFVSFVDLAIEGKQNEDTIEIYRYVSNNQEIPVHVKILQLDKFTENINIEKAPSVIVTDNASIKLNTDVEEKAYIKGYLFEKTMNK